MKKNMPLEGLRWSRDSGSALYDTPQTAVLGRAGGGYEPCAPFLTRQERGLEEGWKGARWAHPERGKAL